MRQKRLAAWAGAIVLTIGLPIAIDQGYFRHNAYALPLLGLVAALLYFTLIVTTGAYIRFWYCYPGWSFVVALAMICMLGGSVYLSTTYSRRHVAELMERSLPVISVSPYDLTGRGRDKFIHYLQIMPLEARRKLRVGCLEWSESACVAAGNFLMLFSEVGWPIDSKTVYRMGTQIPTEGVSIVTHMTKEEEQKLEPLPPHLGMWHKMNDSAIVIWQAFYLMDVPTHTSGQLDLPEQVLGIYFGPEPRAKSYTTADFRRIANEKALWFTTESEIFVHGCVTKRCKRMHRQWEQSVLTYLDNCECVPDSSVRIKWKNLISAADDEQQRITAQRELLSRIVAATQ